MTETVADVENRAAADLLREILWTAWTSPDERKDGTHFVIVDGFIELTKDQFDLVIHILDEKEEE